ncbi:hypothetical protein BaRGS_00027791 [Batillaria attramentaria]|uniref:Peroxisomal biogenesis factor 11 n=1 Tax=Batillaria attramentaria TaxID=370345 RepID=A0ABD0K282_9CAEN
MSAVPSLPRAIVKFQSNTKARDKIFRIVQYGSRFIVWYLTRQSAGGHTLTKKLQKLEAALGLSRKLFRMGNSLELAQKVLDALTLRDPVLRQLAATAESFKTIWLLLDHALWFGKVELIKINLPAVSRWAAWSWLIGLAASVSYNILKLSHQQTQLDTVKLQMETLGRYDLADSLKTEMHIHRLSFWRDFCDLFIPLSSLQYVNPGLGAFCGLLSSVIGFQLEWEKHIKPFKPR